MFHKYFCSSKVKKFKDKGYYLAPGLNDTPGEGNKARIVETNNYQ
jgi:hypothetical protein